MQLTFENKRRSRYWFDKKERVYFGAQHQYQWEKMQIDGSKRKIFQFFTFGNRDALPKHVKNSNFFHSLNKQNLRKTPMFMRSITLLYNALNFCRCIALYVTVCKCNFFQLYHLYCQSKGVNLNWFLFKLLFLYSVILTEYVAIEPRVCVCVCVCVCLCVSPLQPKRMNWFWWNFPQIIWQIFANDIFRGFLNFEFDDVMAAILHFCIAALSRSQFVIVSYTQGPSIG